MDSRRAFVFSGRGQRPAKRRRVLIEDDLASTVSLRKATFRRTWAPVQQGIDAILSNANRTASTELASYLKSASSNADRDERLTVGIISTEQGSASCTQLFELLRDVPALKNQATLVRLDLADCSNLKSALKNLNQKVTASHSPDNEDEDDAILGGTPKLLGYDLRILQRWCVTRNIRHVVVGLPESEGLDPDLLASLITLFHSWRDRIHFMPLLGVGFSIQIFADRLPRAVQKLMRARPFTLAPTEVLVDRVLEYCVCDRTIMLRPGPALCQLLLLRQREHVVGVGDLVQSLKYAYMSHFYGNALSVLLDGKLGKNSFDAAHCDVLRSLPSFRRHCESLLENDQMSLARDLLDSDESLFTYVQEALQKSRERLVWTIAGIKTLQASQVILEMESTSFTDMYLESLSGNSTKSSTLRAFTLRMKLSSVVKVTAVLNQVRDTLLSMPPSDFDLSPDHYQDLIDLVQVIVENEQAATHESTPQRRGAQNKQLTDRELEILQHRQTCCESIENYFEQTLGSMQNVFLHEILFYDLNAPHRDAFHPKVRMAVERALSSPQDYLGCSCCENAGDGLSSSQSPTSILYQLYLESGMLMNIYDLLSAFQAVISDRYQDEQLVKGLFFKGLAELRSMGFIKPSRKKVDHVAKIAWKGL